MEKLNVILHSTSQEIENFRKEAYKKILDDVEFCEILKNAGFRDEEILENIAKFDLYHNDFLLNKKIKTYEECKNLNKFYIYELVKVNGFIEERYREIDAYHRASIYFNKFIYCDFDLDNLYKTKLRDVPRQNISIDLGLQLKSGKKMFYVYGGHNTYKTMAAIAFTNNLGNKLVDTIAFIDCAKRFKEFADLAFAKDKNEFDKIIKILSKVQLLVLDGLGEEYKNEIVRDLILLPILRNRSKEKGVITVITSPYSLKELSKIYTLKDRNELPAREIVSFIKSSIDSEIYSGRLNL